MSGLGHLARRMARAAAERRKAESVEDAYALKKQDEGRRQLDARLREFREWLDEGRPQDPQRRLPGFAEGGEVTEAAFGVYPSAGRRREEHNDREASANVPARLARGALVSIFGLPGDVESLARLLPFLSEEGQLLPTSAELLAMFPTKDRSPAGAAAEELGMWVGLGGPLLKATKKAKVPGDTVDTLDDLLLPEFPSSGGGVTKYAKGGGVDGFKITKKYPRALQWLRENGSIMRFKEGGAVDHGLPVKGKVAEAASERQRAAGNYAKEHARSNGLSITIEVPAGGVRRGKAKDGTEWEREMKHAYGYLRGTRGRDKDHLDVFLGPLAGESFEKVYVIDQSDPETGHFDEHKVMYGFSDDAQALEAYEANYPDEWRGAAAVTEMSLPAFKKWATSAGRRIKPAHKLVQMSDRAKSIAYEDAADEEDPQELAEGGLALDKSEAPVKDAVLTPVTEQEAHEVEAALADGTPEGDLLARKTAYATAPLAERDPSKAARLARIASMLDSFEIPGYASGGAVGPTKPYTPTNDQAQRIQALEEQKGPQKQQAGGQQMRGLEGIGMTGLSMSGVNAGANKASEFDRDAAYRDAAANLAGRSALQSGLGYAIKGTGEALDLSGPAMNDLLGVSSWLGIPGVVTGMAYGDSSDEIVDGAIRNFANKGVNTALNGVLDTSDALGKGKGLAYSDYARGALNADEDMAQGNYIGALGNLGYVVPGLGAFTALAGDYLAGTEEGQQFNQWMQEGADLNKERIAALSNFLTGDSERIEDIGNWGWDNARGVLSTVADPVSALKNFDDTVVGKALLGGNLEKEKEAFKDTLVGKAADSIGSAVADVGKKTKKAGKKLIKKLGF